MAAETAAESLDVKKGSGRRAKDAAASEVVEEAVEAVVEAVRGVHTPVQFHDDGWGHLPVQMRG